MPSWASVQDETPKEACGVFGVYAPGQPVAHLTYLGLYALQHRGQESAGMAVSDGETITVVKDMGLVSKVFDERTPRRARRATSPSATPATPPPARARGATRSRCTATSAAAGFALGHNGNLTNTEALADEAGHAARARSRSDSDLIAELLGRRARPHPEAERRRARARAARSIEVLPHARGRVLVRADGRGPRHRRARPARLPAAVPRQARRRLGARVRDARRSTSSAPTSCASSSPARWS